MSNHAHILMTDPTHYEVSYTINPWMRPDQWHEAPEQYRAAASRAHGELRTRLEQLGARVIQVDAAAGLPDMVFPANAAVILDRRVLLARFASSERAAEEGHFRHAFERLVKEGLIDEVSSLPEGALHEGAGDAIWDADRSLFWAGYGQRTNRAGVDAVAAYFDRNLARLELATPEFYHLDTCFCPLEGGEVLYYPDAFTGEALDVIHAHVKPEQRIIASADDAARFCVNAVRIGRTVVMAEALPALRRTLLQRGYDVVEVDLSPFIMSGGGAYCMTLRLDRRSNNG